MKSKKQFDFNDPTKSMTQLILILAWPVFLEQILTTLVSYADTAMVGALGKNATAAVTISNSPIFLLNGIVMSLGVGITTMVAQATGSKDTELVKKLIRHAILVCFYVGVPITALVVGLHRMMPLWMGADPEIMDDAARYNLIVGFGRFFMIMSMTLNSVFRGYGDTKTPLVANTAMNIVNVVGNFLLINPTRTITVLGISVLMPGAGWGVAGAAAASAFSMLVAGLFTLFVAFVKKGEYRISTKESFRLDKELCGKIFKISLPAMLERMCMSSSGIFVTSTIATLGTASVAANSLALTAESMSFMPAMAFQTAATTLVGQSIGGGKPERAEGFVKRTLALGIALMCITGVLLFVFGDQLISIFTPDQDVIELGGRCMRVVAFMQPVQVVCWVLAGSLRGAGDVNFNFYLTAATNWLIRTLWSILLVRVFGLDLVATEYTVFAEELVRMLFLIWRWRSGKWKNYAVFEKKNDEAEKA